MCVIHLAGECHVAPQRTVGDHDALGVGGGAAGVVEHCHLVGAILIILYIVRAEVHGVLLAEEPVEVLAGIGHLFRAAVQDAVFVAGVGEDAFQSRHFLDIELRPYLFAHEEQLGIGVVHDVMDLFRVELVEDGHSHGTVAQRGQKGDAPACRVTAADGHFVTMLYAGGLEDDM